ncbi:MAG: RidA family protein [SAR324 cluster bacterium]|nr:RidA family protein [SAR324 cluster bacterium]MCZ6844139.1 RidA family protein [SAR324 cluster bacterium]
MSINRIEPGPRMSKAVQYGNTVYLAGQVADDPNLDMAGQTRQVLSTIDALLEKAGSSKSSLLSATIYVTDMRNFQAMNEVWDAWVDPANTPARATVEAGLARYGLQVEIMVIAAVQ